MKTKVIVFLFHKILRWYGPKFIFVYLQFFFSIIGKIFCKLNQNGFHSTKNIRNFVGPVALSRWISHSCYLGPENKHYYSKKYESAAHCVLQTSSEKINKFCKLKKFPLIFAKIEIFIFSPISSNGQNSKYLFFNTVWVSEFDN